MRQMREERRVWAQLELAGLPALVFGVVILMFLGLPNAHAQSPIGAAESCFEAGPDRVPTFAETPVPPVRPGLQAQIRRNTNTVTLAAAPRLVPAGLTHHRELPLHVLNARNKERWTPTPMKSPEFLASAR